MIKKILSGFMVMIFTFSVLLFIFITSLTILLKPNNVRSWVLKSGIYTTLPNTLINQGVENQAVDSSLSFSNPEVQQAAKAALSPKFIQSSAETIIDSAFKWLDGSSDTLDFTIDTTPVKAAFADDIIRYSIERYNALPACKTNTLPKTTDPLTIDCRPAYGVDINQLTADLREQILLSDEFLPNNTLTANTLFGGDSNQNIFGQDSVAPKIYRILQYAPYILGLCLLFAGLSAIALNESRRKTTNKIGSVMIVTSILAMVSIWLTSFSISAMREQLANQQNGTTNIYIDPIINILNALRIDMLKTAGIISIVFVLIGVVILITVKLRSKKKTIPKMPSPKPPVETKKPEAPLAQQAPAKTKMIKPKQQGSPTVITPEQPSTAPEVKRSPSKKLIQ